MIRLKYVDGLKGFAILFVIFYHLIWVSVKDRDSVVVPIFNSLCMQLFFFISGYVSYRGMSKMVTVNYHRSRCVLYPPHIFLGEVFNENVFMDILNKPTICGFIL